MAFLLGLLSIMWTETDYGTFNPSALTGFRTELADKLSISPPRPPPSSPSLLLVGSDFGARLDAVAHISFEVKQAAMTAPAALSLAVAVTGVLGFMVRPSLSPLPLVGSAFQERWR